MILKTGVELHGFDNMSDMHLEMLEYSLDETKPEIIYSGRLKYVTEEQAKEWVERISVNEFPEWYKNYSNINSDYPHAFPLASLKSATNKEWIIITKTQ